MRSVMPEHAKKPSQQQTTQPITPQQPTPAPRPAENEKVSRALDKFARAEPGLIEAAAGAYIKRTDKVEDKQLLGTEERGIKASGSHESALQAVAYGRAEAVELAEDYAVLVQAGVIIGGSLNLKGELEAKYGKLTTKLGANLTL